MKNSTWRVFSRIVSTVKEVARHDPLGLGSQELRAGRLKPPRRRPEAVSSQQRLGRDQKRRCPPLAGEHPAGGGEQDPVGCGEPGPAALAAQHPKLMPQLQDLQVLGAVIGVREDQQAGE
jgi:hypothetical protein